MNSNMQCVHLFVCDGDGAQRCIEPCQTLPTSHEAQCYNEKNVVLALVLSFFLLGEENSCYSK